MDVGNSGVIQQLLKLAQVVHAVLLEELRQEAVVLRAREREAVTQNDGEYARQGLGGKLDVLVGFCIGGLEGGDLIELLVGELDKAGGQGKEAIYLRRGRVRSLLIADIVLKFRPCVLQDGANLHLKSPSHVGGELFHRSRAIFGHGKHQVVGAIAESARDASFGRLVYGALHVERLPKDVERLRDGGGVIQRHAHAHHIVDLLPRLGIDKIAVLPALLGLRLQRGPGLYAGRDAVEDDAGVIEEVLDGGAEVHRGGGVAACPVVVLVAQPRHPTFRHGAPFITPAGIR